MLSNVFVTLAKRGITKATTSVGVGRLVHSLLTDKRSLLYKQFNNSGVALAADLFSTIFASAEILRNFNIFDYPGLGYEFRNELDSAGVDVFIEALSRAIEMYLTTEIIPARHINNGLVRLSEIFAAFCSRIYDREKAGELVDYSYRSDWWTLQRIVKFLGHDYGFLASETALPAVAEIEKQTIRADFQSDQTINSGIAAAMYKIVESTTSLKTGYWPYLLIAELMHAMMFQPDLKPGYREAFLRHLWDRIGTNVIRRYYPAVTRTYLQFMAFLLISSAFEKGSWISEEVDRVRRLLYVDLGKLLDDGAQMLDGRKMIDALLPDSITYESRRFYFKTEDAERIAIDRPLEGAATALTGVDLDNWAL